MIRNEEFDFLDNSPPETKSSFTKDLELGLELGESAMKKGKFKNLKTKVHWLLTRQSMAYNSEKHLDTTHRIAGKNNENINSGQTLDSPEVKEESLVSLECYGQTKQSADDGMTKQSTYQDKEPNHNSQKGAVNCLRSFMHRQDAAQWIMAVLTVFIILLTGISTCSNWEQVVAYKKANREGLRAYMVLSPTVRFWNIGENLVPSVTFTVKNVGKTPAYAVSIYTLITMRRGTPPYRLVDKLSRSSFMLGGGDTTATQQTSARYTLTKAELADIKTNNWKLCFLGKVSYEDVFKKQRWLYFGAYYDPITTRPEAIPGFATAN